MGLVLPQMVDLQLSKSNWKHYESLGYKIPYQEELVIKVRLLLILLKQ